MSNYSQILKEELVTALGCTEPIAIALLASRFADALGEEPEHITIRCSGNIIKNVKSVMVPNTGGLKGIEVAVLAGVISKKHQANLEVLNDFSDSDRKRLAEMLERKCVTVEHLKSPAVLHIIIDGKSKNNTASAELIHAHTNIVKVTKNGKVIFEKPFDVNANAATGVDRSCLNVKDILEFARTVDISEVAELLRHQVELNMHISEQGFQSLPEQSIAKVILKATSGSQYYDATKLPTIIKAKIALASAIEARMLGLSFPVVTNSGSGNQGLCVTIPVVVYAREMQIPEEQMLRALIVSNLIANHQKTGIGKLSAYCGAVSATTAAMAAIAFMKGGDYNTVSQTISNSLATSSGIVCDGANVSCAAKALASLETANLAYEMAASNVAFRAGDGIVKDDIEKTIRAVGVLAKQGMKETDAVLLEIMLD